MIRTKQSARRRGGDAGSRRRSAGTGGATISAGPRGSILREDLMIKDLRHAVRMLLNAKGWTLVVILSLGLGIGANTALFSAVDGMLLTKIPVRDPETLVRFRWVGRNDMVTSSSDYGPIDVAAYGGQRVRTTFSYPMYRQFVADNRTLVDLLTCAPLGRTNVVMDGHAELASGFLVSGNYFSVLGVNARLGRVFVPDDDRATAPDR